jgi:hypothetical protein
MNSTKKWLLVWTLLLLVAPLCDSQELKIEKPNDGHGNYWLKWDSVQDRMIAYRGASDASMPAGRVYDRDGHSFPIYPLRDLPESRTINIWDAAATPEGGMILAGLVGYGPPGPPGSRPPVKSVLLTYGPAGDLRKFWDVLPYEFDLVAVDGQGNVYALGNADLEEPYFMLVKYSPEGKVLRQFLSTSLFPVGDHILSPGGGTEGLNRMFIAGNVLFVWFARTQELLRFSLSGDLLSRVSLAHSLSQLAAANGNDGISLHSLAAGEGDQIIAGVVIWNTQSAKTPPKSLLVQLSPDGSSAAPLPVNLDKSQFLGKSSTGKLILLEPSTGLVKTY